MASMPEQNRVVLGVDTHADAHVAVAVDEVGQRLGHVTVPSTPAGYQQLLNWASPYGTITRIGIEGAGSWGAGLSASSPTVGIS